MPGIEGKVIAITGASSGIGEATAVLLASRGAKVVLGARRKDLLEVVAARIVDQGGEVAFLPMDVRRREDLSALVAVATERFGTLDVLVNNAGIGPVSLLDDLRVDDWDDMIDINIKGLLYGMAAALPLFRAQESGQFVNTVSTAAYKTVAGQSVYSATKVAAKAISEGLRQEAGAKLRVSIISPGLTDTGFTDTVPDAELRAQMVASKAAFAISPDAIARATAFAIEQPDDVDVSEIVVRPTAQG